MPNKDQYRYRIMKTYGILVDYEGEAEHARAPAKIKQEETFKQWKLRVLGPRVSGVTVMKPVAPAPNSKMCYLTVLSSSDSVASMFREMQKEAMSAKREAIDDTKHRYATFPKENLEDILQDPDLKLEDSVKHYLQHLIEQIDKEIEQDDLMRKLVLAYNCAVHTVRQASLG